MPEPDLTPQAVSISFAAYKLCTCKLGLGQDTFKLSGPRASSVKGG